MKRRGEGEGREERGTDRGGKQLGAGRACLLKGTGYTGDRPGQQITTCSTCVHCIWRPEVSTTSSVIGVIDGCEPPYGCWELNPSPQEEQPVLLDTEPSHQP